MVRSIARRALRSTRRRIITTGIAGEAVKKLGQAPRSYAKSLQNTDIRSEPVPFFHSLGARLCSNAHETTSAFLRPHPTSGRAQSFSNSSGRQKSSVPVIWRFRQYITLVLGEPPNASTRRPSGCYRFMKVIATAASQFFDASVG